MTLQNKATYDVILSVNARNVVNGILRIYRSLLQRNESELKSRNLRGLTRKSPPDTYPYPTWRNVDDEGLYTGSGSKSVEEFLLASDLQGISRQIAQLPTLEELRAHLAAAAKAYEESRAQSGAAAKPVEGVAPDLDGDDRQPAPLGAPPKVKPEVHFDNVIRTVLSGFEPHPIIGPVLNLVFEQADIRGWIEDVRLDDVLSQEGKNGTAARVLKLVREVSETYYEYLMLILKALEQPEAQARLLPKKYWGSRDVLKDRVIRCVYTLAIFRGHEKYDKAATPFLQKGIPYDLPRKVVISPPRLSELLRAKVVLDRGGFGWSKDFRGHFDPDADGDGAADGSRGDGSMEELEAQLKKLLDDFPYLQGDLKKFVDFACSGLPGGVPQIESSQPGAAPRQPPGAAQASEAAQTCGWYPKEEPTHPIVLLGSTGTSKSSVMMSGLTTFFAASGSVGVSVRSNSSDDVSMLDAYQTEYYEGRMPKATETHTRYSVQLTTVDARDPNKRKNFIFTDVPGEMVARSLDATDTDPVVMNLLKYAEMIVFFFDLATEPVFYNAVNVGQVREEWADLRDHVRALREERRGWTNQLLLLGKLIEDLRQIRKPEGGDDEIKDKVSVICVVPKADFFAGEKTETTRFLTSFYADLKNRKILDTSQLDQGEETNNFRDLRSMAGVSFQPDGGADGEGGGEEVDLLAKQEQIINYIDARAREAFRRVGDALGPQASSTDKHTLETSLNVGLLNVLDSTFRKVYLLPVSAQGRPALPKGGRVELNHPPSQKLAEYVFIIPTVLALRQDA
ncbi:MAG TPA: hypothetical protein VF668_05360 [Pyrinomonadaceae bacterium]|jgi:hypothetical protein